MQKNISRYHLIKKQALTYAFSDKVLPQMAESLGDLIRRQMKVVGIKSNSELARLIGKSSAYVGDLINNTAKTKSGTYTPSQEVVGKLARALQISESEILSAMNYLTSELQDVESAELDENVRVQLLGAKNFTEEDKREFMEAFQVAYEVAKRRIAERKKQND